MAKDITINGASYSDVPSILIPLATGSGYAEFIDKDTGGGGGLPSGFTAIAKGVLRLGNSITGANTFKVTHNLGVVPDMFLFYAQENIATTYSMLYAFRSDRFGYRGSTYLNLCGYHGNSTTTVTSTNVTTTYGIKTLTESQATITSYSSSTSYGWRAGTYEWIAIKFS